MQHHQLKIGQHVLIEQGSLRHGIWRKLRSHGAGDTSRLATPEQAKHRKLPTGRQGVSARKRWAQSTRQSFLTSSRDDSCTRAIARWDDAGRAVLPGAGKTLDDVAQVVTPLVPMPIRRRIAATTLWDALSSKVWRSVQEGGQHSSSN